ncbi:putative Zn-dependent protease [Thermoclostridium stercorarium subsp. stercorarium DSM 8532]|uniref:Peptidase n=3 Tax=Thermoclostridium stercorarium TaxID=1510 RepID=A0A1B1YKV2_THEST|nr:TldD/PmbA family protein [Thermoclostridium stercorarium]AGC68515.1 putative Zn-dependent protease [Thermoclostridium stercorarium subsp. stercorarium DSM 8532]AGI39531.1 protease [Thermoclostridium stercorarium subsp. stercorarium DSM 8532]ANW98872.1 peptidase [Thermoclostridium stercorarium subsp. thermolacticum DSM 2910]ANX01398.1 peptidase [Thermoclostridium stercorarium subsp. leptospartum DSM 9219]UZQ84504.1 TldD/PmbA family protein [Thermoclostridium stercorarium]
MLEDKISKFKSLLHDHTELRAQVNTRRRVTLLNGNLVGNIRSDESGVSARVYKGGVYGFASSSEYTDERVKAVLAAAEENAKFMDMHVKKNKPGFPSVGTGKKELLHAVRDVEQKVFIDFAKEIDAYISKKYPALASRTISVFTESIEKLLVVSDGVDSHSLMPRSYIYIFLSTWANDGTTVELFKPLGGFGYFDENFTNPADLYEAIDNVYNELMKKAEGVYCEAGYKDVVMHPNLAGILAHEAVGHTVEADLVLGGSVAAHNLGRQVASELITMVDFAHTALGKPVPLPVYVDDEGTPAEDAVLIKDGILVGYMNSRETAQHFGMKPQGNARAFLFSDEPLIRMRNTAILPGKDKLEDMIAAIDDGYYLTETNNGQADTTGEFMFGVCMGYEIKNGKLGRAIRDTTISGVAFEMLKTVDMLSDDMVWLSSGYCGKKQPMPVGMGGPAIKCKVNIGGR